MSDTPNLFKCPGCQRTLEEPHKMCPAWGTDYYMSGRLFTEEAERVWAVRREIAIQRASKWAQEHGTDLD